MTRYRPSRRDALKLGAGMLAAGTFTAFRSRTGFAAGVKRIPISLQLYSVRRACAENFDKTVAAVAKLGFQGVEFAGYHKYRDRAAALRKLLDSLGLKAAGTHISTASFDDARIAETIDFHRTIGCKLLIVPGDRDFCHPEKSKVLAERFRKGAEKLKPHGMYCGYHNHTREFGVDPKTGKTYWDLFAERTGPDVVLQLDCGWAAHAGRDPAAYIRKYPGRTKITHFKPEVEDNRSGKKAFLGQDSVDWRSVITACYDVGGTEWITVEQEKYPDGKSPMECCRISLAGLKKILTDMGH